jgi:hypothetical protein
MTTNAFERVKAFAFHLLNLELDGEKNENELQAALVIRGRYANYETANNEGARTVLL